jgi:hypothetical protein
MYPFETSTSSCLSRLKKGPAAPNTLQCTNDWLLLVCRALQYTCNPLTGMCNESCPKPNSTPCKGGSCQAGKCVPDKTACPPDPSKCSKYKYNNATAKCELEIVTCPQQPPDACKMVSNHAAVLWCCWQCHQQRCCHKHARVTCSNRSKNLVPAG